MELVAGVHPVLGWILGIAGALVVLAGAWKAVARPAIDMFRQIGRFLDDWYGREDPDGVRQPGIRARLDNMETKVEQVHHQTHPNGGESLKDVVVRTENQVQGLSHRMDIHLLEARARDTHLASHDARLEAIEREQDHRHHHPPTPEEGDST